MLYGEKYRAGSACSVLAHFLHSPPLLNLGSDQKGIHMLQYKHILNNTKVYKIETITLTLCKIYQSTRITKCFRCFALQGVFVHGKQLIKIGP